MKEEPLITVIMPVYNAEKYLEEAIESVLNQTYKNIEFIILNDGSTDRSLEIVQRFQKQDLRVQLINNKKNLKQPKTRNKGLKLAHGKYIANMDADDISLPQRFSIQVEFMEQNPDIDICGAYAEVIGGDKRSKIMPPITDADIKDRLPFSCALVHPTVMFRRTSVEKYEIRYNEDFRYAQDFELWSRLVWQGVKFHNISEVLLLYRMSAENISTQHSFEQKKMAQKVVLRNIQRILGDEDLILMTLNEKEKSLIILERDLETLRTFLEVGKKQYSQKFYFELEQYILNQYCFLGINAWQIYIRKTNLLYVRKKWIIKYFIKCFLKGRHSKLLNIFKKVFLI